MSDIPSDATKLTVEQAAERFLDAKRVDVSEATVQDYYYRLEQFIAWCHEQDVREVHEITPFHIDEFRRYRARDLAPTTLKGQMVALNQYFEYLERIGAVEDLSDAVDIPRVDVQDQTSDIHLAADEAAALLEHYRTTGARGGTGQHAFLELAWNTGARMGGIRALDLDDYDRLDDGGVLRFRHRRDTETPLKNKSAGERVVRIADEVCQQLDRYIEQSRSDKRDDYGRSPLLCGRQGRPNPTTLRAWCYLVTQPCAYRECPHGYERETCDYRERGSGSKCPSSRSPHQVRSGSITWQLNQGIPLEIVAERVNASADVIQTYYDKSSKVEQMERREPYTSDLDITGGETQ